MNTIERLNRELAYNAWANREVLRSLLVAQAAPDRATKVMAHIIGAEWLWLRRLGQAGIAIEVWPVLPLADCEKQLGELSRAWRAYLSGVTPDSLGRQIRYTNSKGEDWCNTVADMLTHIVLHSSYHRGQIATLLGRAGETAAYSDYIECVRRGYLEGGWPAE